MTKINKKICPNCGLEFLGHNNMQLFCSPFCKDAIYAKRRIESWIAGKPQKRDAKHPGRSWKLGSYKPDDS